jgi:hypothetical protein
MNDPVDPDAGHPSGEATSEVQEQPHGAAHQVQETGSEFASNDDAHVPDHAEHDQGAEFADPTTQPDLPDDKHHKADDLDEDDLPPPGG